MSDRTIKRHDTWPPHRAILEEESETEPGVFVPIDLTTALKVKFILKSGDGTTLVEGICVFPKEPGGKVEYVWGATDTEHADEYTLEHEIEWSATHFQTVPNENYNSYTVEQDLGGH